MDNDAYWNFWGKADKDEKTWHPLVCHLLDVGAVARVIAQNDHIFTEKWEKRTA